MDFLIPKYVNNILDELDKNGFQGFIVGGSVRDLLLGKEPSDYDIATNATPDEIQEVFRDYKTIDIGKNFGTIIVLCDGNRVEVTTYRTEGRYVDGRRPSEVSFTRNIEDDLSRRDFTINAMAYNSKVGFLDLFKGRQDLNNKIIRTVGNPYERFEEDHLRILRAVRFSTQLQFTIEEDTYNACRAKSKSLLNISMERIREEFFKILLSKEPSYGIRVLEDLNILELFIPELVDAIGFNQHNPHHDKDVYNHILCVVDATSPVLVTRLAALFHDIGKPRTLTIDEEGIGHFYEHDRVGSEMAEDIMTRMKCSKDLIRRVCTLILEHMSHHNNLKDKGLKRQISRVGKEDIFNLIDLQKSDRMCSSSAAKIDFLIEREKKIREILNNNEPYEKNQLKISGDDIKLLGYKEGRMIGEILNYLLEKVMKNPNLNEKEKLIDITLQKFKNKI